MKVFHLILLLFSALMLTGCIDEDLSSCNTCKKDNLRLDFHYTDEGGADIFTNNIQGVDVFVYDSNGGFVKQQYVAKNDLSVFAGAKLSLCPGSYRIVCWANAAVNTSIPKPAKGNPFSDGIVHFATKQSRAVATVGGDPLYYAPYIKGVASPHIYTVTVPKKGTETATINFRNAHIIIEIYVKGFENKTSGNQSLMPLIELTGVPAGYSFDLQTFGPAVTYSGVATKQNINGQQMAAINFLTPLFERDTPIELLIKEQSDGTTLTTVNLDDFIKDNDINIGNTTKVVVPIMVEYNQSSVIVRIPNWTEVPVEPET